MIRLGQLAPNFTAPALLPSASILPSFTLSDYLGGEKGVVLFYPLDFTFVCPSELLALNARLEAFHRLGAKVLVVSVDSVYTHLAWSHTPLEKGGVGPLGFPMVSDATHEIARSYGVYHANEGVAFRATFILDEQRIARHFSMNDLPLGRNIDEILRLIEALNHFQKEGEVCPAQWKPGKPAMKPDHEGVTHYLTHCMDDIV